MWMARCRRASESCACDNFHLLGGRSNSQPPLLSAHKPSLWLAELVILGEQASETDVPKLEHLGEVARRGKYFIRRVLNELGLSPIQIY